MKKLIEEIENKEEFFKKLLKSSLKKDILEIEEHEVMLNTKTYHFFYSHDTQTIIIDGLFHDAIDAILKAEFIVTAISKKCEFTPSNIFNMMFVSSYIDNRNNLNLRAFKVISFSSALRRYCEPIFLTIHEITKSQVANIIEGVK